MKNMIRNWLEIKSPDSVQIDIEQLNNYESQAFINNIWYRGDPNEIQQFIELHKKPFMYEYNDSLYGYTKKGKVVYRYGDQIYSGNEHKKNTHWITFNDSRYIG